MSGLAKQMQEETKARRARMGMITKPPAVVLAFPKEVLRTPKPPKPPKKTREDRIAEARAELHRIRTSVQEQKAKVITGKIKEIIFEVCREFEVDATDILSSRRTADIIIPRHVVFYLARKLTGNSLPVIGRRVGGRDHTTVLHGAGNIEGRLMHDELLRSRVDLLIERLRDFPRVDPETYGGA